MIMAVLQQKSKKQPPVLHLEPFRGMNVSESSTQISKSESPDMLNMNIDEKGALNKRNGYERILSMGTGPIKGMFVYRKSDGTEKFLYAHGGKLYLNNGRYLPTWDSENLEATWEV